MKTLIARLSIILTGAAFLPFFVVSPATARGCTITYQAGTQPSPSGDCGTTTALIATVALGLVVATVAAATSGWKLRQGARNTSAQALEALANSASRAAHRRDLGFDPATQRFRPNEADTGLRVEAARGIRLGRSRNPKVDWEDVATGKTYDAVGPFPSRHFDRQWPNLQTRIVDHLAKADFVPIDVSQFIPDQIAKIIEFITRNQLAPRVFLVGE